VAAVNDYFDGLITKAQVVQVVILYFDSKDDRVGGTSPPSPKS